MTTPYISAKQEQQAKAWVRDHKIVCPACKNSQLELLSPICPPGFLINAGVPVSGNPEDPILRLVCPACAYVLHFDARTVLDLPHKGFQFR